jgi:dihydrolipoamide dehydrogenase
MGQEFDIIIIGAGPGGYVAAIRAAQLGMRVACVEKDKTLGGTCLNRGCIPSKALLESSELYVQALEKFASHGIQTGDVSVDLKKMIERKDQVVKQLTGGVAGLFKKNKIAHIIGQARFEKDKSISVAQETGTISLTAKNVIIATGSEPITLPHVTIDQTVIVDSTGALSLSEIPKRLIVIGGGYIGLELGSVYSRLGSSVIVIEALERIVPNMDQELGKNLQRILQKQGLSFRLSTKVQSVEVTAGVASVVLQNKDGAQEALESDVVLVAVGRKPYTQGLGLNEIGIQTDTKGRITVDSNGQTNVPGVYAIGDVIGGAMLAHKASEEGVALVERLAGKPSHVNHEIIPSVVYTWPEVASVGLTEEQVKEKNIDYKVAKFPFMANGRSLAAGEKDGFVKIIADKATDKILGAHIIGPRASDLIAEMVLAMSVSAKSGDIARLVHAHPTFAEGIKEAALGLGAGFIHL